jgi:short-subunit dehydrogenase
MAHAREPRSVLITGASSGIGAALAEAYARPGVRLFLAGRDAARLDAVAARCTAAEVETRVLDVTDAADMARWIAEADAEAPLGLVIANAGISGGTAGGGEGEAQVRRIFAVNLDGVLNTLWPVIPAMRARRSGQLAIVSSVAGFRGIPGSPAYSASKAAVLAYGDALRGELHADGVHVAVICPGYVVSRMTDANDFPMPWLMPAEKAAGIIKRRLARGKGRIVFPWPMLWTVRVLQALPIALTDPLLRRLPKKG